MLTAREIAAQHGLKRSGGGWSGTCPACGYKDALRLNESRGQPLWWCANGCDRDALTAAITGDAAPAPAREPAPAETASGGKAAAMRFLHACRPAEGTIVVPYLRSRLLESVPGLLFMEAARHPSGKRFPCMVAVLVDIEGHRVAVHRTFLAPGGAGKAGVDPPRMTLGPVRGAAVRLHEATECLVVGGGIETSLAAAKVLGMPAWAAVSAGNMADHLALPQDIRDVIVAADNDPPGLRAANRAVARWKAEGRTVRLAVPDRAGADFNNVLRDREAARAG